VKETVGGSIELAGKTTAFASEMVPTADRP